jgi:hypothetical protein
VNSPARCPATAEHAMFSLAGRLPSTPSSSGSLPAFVRALPRYYATVRLPRNMHADVRLLAFSDRPAPGQRRASLGSPGSRAWSFQPCLGSRPAGLRPVHRRLKLSPTAVWPSVDQDNVGTREVSMISEFHTQPACTPVNASPASLRPPAHDSGSGRFATPSLRGSFIRDSKPVYPGAFPDSCSSLPATYDLPPTSFVFTNIPAFYA